MTRILIVDDEKEIADLLEFYLQNEGYNVVKVNNGKDAVDIINNHNIDLAILDVMLPDIDGFTILKKIREKYFYPVIMLTAKVEDIDKIMGLTIGADDYITKPFNPLELIARVKTQIRRINHYNKEVQSSFIDINGLYINEESHKVDLYGKEVDLTPLEYNILLYLAKNRGKVISSEKLFTNIWGERYLDNNNTVMAHIARLREKLNEDARNPKFIRTVWGVGYIIE
ncbi:VanR-ABDEGLN family response regulator transcription factor [Senegalia massiliensis]|uniref:Stage 0 sporulation protein A homolog n=1 Tax=Senegalia massiliensis TaxID=1720316 RepID=A0A845R0B0_9CLOT|nr:VanR-ABDEGLN family response regulator transcription factor [Senegalia massiliensis]NBI07654.1 VanR-ABDEGLN family DNA-binding response regulator [Senegalia massiliensis]NWO06592.1 VanR-ABDEGLN family response regulator transcription factor [Alteromonadaceae bacterium]